MSNEDADNVRRLLREEGVDVPEAERARLRIAESDEIPRCQLRKNISEFGADLGRLLREACAYFIRDGEVVSVDLEKKVLVPVSPRAFRVNVERHVVTYQEKYIRGGSFQEKETMGIETAATVLVAEAFKEQLYEVTRIHDQRLPVMRRDGKIERLEPGLDVEAKVFTMPDSIDYPLDMPGDVARRIWREIHSEFPFGDWDGQGWETGTSRSFSVHLMAALSQFAWCLVSAEARRLGFLYHSNSPRSGKSLLAEIILMITNGMVATSSWKKDEDKMAAMLDVIVRNRSSYAFFDNLKGHLSSEEFEGFITGLARKVRLFHTQIECVYPNRAAVIMTGNALTWSSDIDGRVLISDLYLEDADPQARKVRKERTSTDFLEPGLRGDLLAAMWAFVREWDAIGRPAAPNARAGFHEWCGTIGGIVIAQKFGDPLAVRSEEMSGGNSDFADMLALVERLASFITGTAMIAEFKFEDVIEAAVAINAFESLMKGKERKDEQTDKLKLVLDPRERAKLGELLSATYGGRVFNLRDGRRVKWGNRGKNRGRRYQVMIVGSAPAVT